MVNEEALRAQLAIAQWYIERAERSAASARAYCLRQARLACHIIQEVLPRLELSGSTREGVQAELAILRRKLEITAGPDLEALEE